MSIAELEIARLAEEIARQRSPFSALDVAASPTEIARALYLTGWRPPTEEVSSELDEAVPQQLE